MDERDPFLPPESARRFSVVSPPQDSAPEPPSVPPAVSPKDAGAALTGVVAGPNGGSAMINGRTYCEGDQVVLQKDEMSHSFHLAEVRPGGVVLMRDGTRYELRIPLPIEMLHSAVSVSPGASAPGTPP